MAETNDRAILTEAPYFNMTRAAANLTSCPPFDLSGMTIRYLPLRAKINSLRKFCDDYLNLMPPEIAEFRPSMPYVFLQLVHYGHMAQEVQNSGWVSQNEVVFSIFLDWYKKVDGEYIFQDTASVSPFIFVDQAASQATGREVYGWPKLDCWSVRGRKSRTHPI